MVKINWTRQSIEDIHSIRAYYIERSTKFTEELTDKIIEKAAVLENFPNMGRIVPEIGNAFIRELIFQNYRIVSESRIDIIAVHNGLRPLSKDSIFN